MLFQTASLLAVASLAVASNCKPRSTTVWETQYTATGAVDVAAAAATAKTSSPTSRVKGKAFDRLAIIYFENQNYAKSFGDPNFKWFTTKGITLTNYFAVTHPSQPNYMASIAGDYFGMDNDDFDRAPLNVSTVIDLLESRGISWGHYQEDLPYSGYEGIAFVNQLEGSNDYVRKHNPAIMHDSVAHYERRLSLVKNLSMVDTTRSMFHKDLRANTLPQWMFITPNMTSDGHDTSVTTAGKWCRKFLEPLLTDRNFMQNTLVLLTWDENETYSTRNNILGILLGDAVPSDLVGTSDDNFYNHYSEIATVSANWDLPTLGRWDVGANVFAWVAQKTGDKLRQWSSNQELQSRYWNSSYAGFFNSEGGNSRFPAPNLKLDQSVSGRTILQSIKDTWANSDAPTYYQDSVEVPDGLSPPPGYAPED
ncbi:putative acid phosphatase [Tolypocladium ophioglossoides CBS 100239]|uniref:Putative acid phosphatase n=1 Tax=Tolypocladium ophioglossoides (strain CBS 100239) TaxID=1163406 RepID=A0A0L0NL98_TOLOC|nr:putative acid phosphatase [Tolypocladium ophioglossoides CBS 100239]